MTKNTNAALIFLLSTPLLLGAVASKQQAAKKNVAPSHSATKTESAVQIQPMSMAQQTSLEAPTQELALPTSDASSSGGNYAIDWYSINGGGTVNAASTNYQMGASIGQSVAGAASSPSYQMGIGFWYGAGGSGSCACDCHGDPGGNCDGVQDILDVVQTVNVAFRGAASILDPNAACPYETTDTNCSLSTDVIDVVKMVNVAFRGANAATEFCNPCP